MRRECGRQIELRSWCRLRDLVLAVASAYDVHPRSLLVRWSKGNEARQVLLYLATTHCRGRYSATELARRLGRVSVSGLAKAHERMAERLRVDTKLGDTVRRIETLVTGKSTT